MNQDFHHIGIVLAVASSLTIFQFCKEEPKNDTNKVAEERNEEKFRSKESKTDADFVVKAVESNYAEIKLSQLAQEKSGHEKLVSLAKDLESDQKKALKQLKDIAGKKAITLPDEEDRESEDKINDLRKEEEIKDFNKKWTNEMIDKHEELIDDLESALKEDILDSDVKEWVEKVLPELRSDLDKLNDLQDEIKS